MTKGEQRNPMKYRISFLLVLAILTSCGGGGNANLEAENAKLKEENARLRAQLEGRQVQPSQSGIESPQINIQNAVLEIQQLKVYPYGSAAYIDFKLTNKSNQFIDFWSVGVDISNARNEYLGHYNTPGSNLRPGQSVTSHLIFSDVNASEVVGWKPSIERISIDMGGGRRQDATRYYTLQEAKP